MPIEYREYRWWGLLTKILPVDPHPDVFYFLNEHWPSDTPNMSVRNSVAFPDENSSVLKWTWGTDEHIFRPRHHEEINEGHVHLRRKQTRKIDRFFGNGEVEFRWVPYTVTPSRRFSLRRRM